MQLLKLFLVSALLPATALANTYIIPDLSRNKREIHATAAAAGWSTRKTVGVNYTSISDETKTDHVKSNESESQTVEPFAFYRTEFGLTAELSYSAVEIDSEDFNPSAPKDKTDITGAILNLGYQLPTAPMTIGLSHILANTEDKDGTTGDKAESDDSFIGLSFSYKLPSEFYVGAGVTQNTEKNKPAGGGSTKDKDETFHFGVGFIKGEMSQPEVAVEVVLALENEEGQKTHELIGNAIIEAANGIELTGLANLTIYDGTIDGTSLEITGGLDYQTGDFYIAPEVTLSSLQYETGGGTEYEVSSSKLRLEGGYRKDVLMAYAYIAASEDEDEKVKPAPKSKDEIEGGEFGLGLSYNF